MQILADVNICQYVVNTAIKGHSIVIQEKCGTWRRQISVPGTYETALAEPISLNSDDFWHNLRIINTEGQNFIDYLGTNVIAGWLAPIR